MSPTLSRCCFIALPIGTSHQARGPSHNNSVTPRADNLVPPTLHPHPSLNITSASLSSHIIISHLKISYNRIPPPPRKSTPLITPQCEVHLSQIRMMSLEERLTTTSKVKNGLQKAGNQSNPPATQKSRNRRCNIASYWRRSIWAMSK